MFNVRTLSILGVCSLGTDNNDIFQFTQAELSQCTVEWWYLISTSLLTWDYKSADSRHGDAMTYVVKNHQLNVLSWLESKHILAKIHRQSSKQLTETWESRPKTQLNVFQEARCLSGIKAVVLKWSQLVFLPVEVGQTAALFMRQYKVFYPLFEFILSAYPSCWEWISDGHWPTWFSLLFVPFNVLFVP